MQCGRTTAIAAADRIHASTVRGECGLVCVTAAEEDRPMGWEYYFDDDDNDDVVVMMMMTMRS